MNGSLGSPFNFFGLTTLVVSRKPGSFHNRTYRPTLGANPCEEYLEKGMKQPAERDFGDMLPQQTFGGCYLRTGSELGQKRAVEIGSPLKNALTD